MSLHLRLDDRSRNIAVVFAVSARALIRRWFTKQSLSFRFVRKCAKFVWDVSFFFHTRAVVLFCKDFVEFVNVSYIYFLNFSRDNRIKPGKRMGVSATARRLSLRARRFSALGKVNVHYAYNIIKRRIYARTQAWGGSKLLCWRLCEKNWKKKTKEKYIIKDRLSCFEGFGTSVASCVCTHIFVYLYDS